MILTSSQRPYRYGLASEWLQLSLRVCRAVGRNPVWCKVSEAIERVSTAKSKAAASEEGKFCVVEVKGGQ